MTDILRDGLQRLATLHRDESGETRDIVMVGALITIPLVMLLIAFGKNIATWLQEAFKGLDGAQSDVSKVKIN